MGVSGDVQGYLVEMQLHSVGVGEGQRQPCAHAPRRTDGAKEIGTLVALVRGLDRPRSPPGPLSDKAVLLADAGLVLEPDLDLPLARHAPEMCRKRPAEVFLKAAMTSPSCLGCRGRALICEKPRCFSSLPMVRSWYSTPKRSAITR